MPCGRQTFARNPDSLLWLGLTARRTKKDAYEWLDITDEVVALDLELAVTYRLLKFDVETQQNQAKLIAYEVSKIFGSGEDTGESAEVW